MSVYMYKCRDCGAEFDEPYVYYERHGFTYGSFEKWSECPHCGSCDYDYAHVVEREEALETEEEEDDED